MTNKLFSGVTHRRPLVIWTLFCIIAGATFLAYTLSSLENGHGEFVMPLDDVYIHFQYARQMAAGQPYVYNPGLPATSGATSFLYPYVLAFGYLMGFQELKLGLWAMGVGALAMIGSMWLVYKLIRLLYTQDWVAVLVAVAFGISGPVAWHFMSGMETGLVILFALGTLYTVVKVVVNGRVLYGPFVVWATALALIRPEGGVFAVTAVAVVWWMGRNLTPQPPFRVQRGGVVTIALVSPLLAVGVQPLVNWIYTGSAVASGNAAKSILGTVPFYWDDVIRRILGNFVQLWVEFGTGISPREGLYVMPFMLVLALIGIGWLLVERKLRVVGVMLVLWLAGVSAMLATLDTVFWHFKRYQMPLVALLFPLAGWGIGVVASYKRQAARENTEYKLTAETQRLFFGFALTYIVFGVMLVVAAVTSVQFWGYYGLNVGYVYEQPLQMARWLHANTPVDAVIAVHDVGMMRYMGGRTTLDIVGLTTKGAADYWRNGPGAVAEFLMKEKPDYIASYGYGHGYGLGMIADTDIYGKPVASFPAELDDHANVALAANFQGIYKPDWTANQQGYEVLQPNLTDHEFDPSSLISDVNVGDIASETAAHYKWQDYERLGGFATEIREFDYLTCIRSNCRLMDGGRLINGEETFDFPVDPNENRPDGVVLVSRLHPENAGTIDIYANGELVGTRLIPAMPGNWLEVATLIPNSVAIKSLPEHVVHIRVVPHVAGGYYMPYYHWLYRYSYQHQRDDVFASRFQDGAIQLASTSLNYQPDTAKLGVNFEWYTDGSAKGDYKVFVHLYDDVNKAPVAQMDMRPGNGTLPPGNWLPGVLHDTITVDLKGVAAGTYKIAIGMYDPVTFERLQPTGGDEQGRLFIGEVKIKG
jgi:hypothetical protein